MASSSSSLNWKYDVFLSFRGKDVRVTFLSHFLKELDRKLITAFKGKEIERSHSLWPYLVQAIRSSRIAVVIFSKNYASSSWCLNELLEIVNCKDNIVIPVFYGLDPSHVRNQTGDFGRIFQETCKKNTEQKQNQWKKALNDVANTLGFHSATWDDEAKMIEAIANDVLGKLLLTSSEDSDDLVGIEAHIAEMSLLLQLESEEVRMVGIWGSSGIGKTTIASALFNRLSRHFQGSIFIDRVFISKSKKDYSRRNPDDPNMKLHLQGHFLSEILGKKDIKIDHLGALGERLKHQKVLIIIDDLDDQEVLDTLVGQTQWFGYGSRIIVVTNDKHFLRAHGIDHIYEVSFPSEERAQEMLCRSAFKQNYPPEGFGKLVADVVRYAGNLPLGLNVLGSYLRDRDEVYWMHLLQSVLDGKIGNTLRVSYDGLDREEDKIIFLHIACLFNYVEVKDIKQLLADSNLGVSIGLTHLVDKSLIHIRGDHVVMHRLLQEMGRKIVRTQTIDKPGEREFLVDPNDISYVLSEGIGTQKILGISLDTSEIAFKGMRNLRFLRVYKNFRKEGKLHFSESFVYLPPKLNLLYWPKYPMSCMPSNFRPENLVKLKMQNSKLHKLWEGVVPLTSLKKMDLQGSTRLEDIPNLSMATNLEKLRLVACMSLVELPSSIRNLNKLLNLDMSSCKSLAILPTGFNLKSLEHLNLNYCSELRTFPEISTNISDLRLFNTNIEEFPSNLHLENLVRVTISKKKRDGKQWEGVEQNFLIKLLMTDNKTRAKALKNAVQFSGVIAVEIQEVFRNQMVVTGDGIDIVGLIMTLRKKVAFAELVSVNKDEPFKDGFKLPIKKYVFRSYLKRVGGERDRILWDKKSDRNLIQKKKSDRNLKEAKIVQAEAKSRRVVPVIEEKDFVGHLVKVLKNNGVNVDEFPSGDIHFKGIEESRMALVIFSSRYAESRGCLNELVKIKELMEERKLLVIPIFYNVEPLEVTQLKGDFGVKFWNSWRISRDHHIIEWKEALKSVASIKGIYLKEHCSESEFITLTVNKVVDDLSTQNGENPSLFISTGKGKSTDFSKHPLFGMEQRMEQLEKKLEFDCNETLIIGVVGMPGIGKTTLAMMLHEKWNCKFLRCVPFLGIRKKSEIYKKSEEYGLVWLRKTLLEVLLEGKFPAISDKTTHESVKNKLLQKKVFVVLDDVSNKKQLDFLLSDLTWIKKGSKIIITTSDQSLLKGLADDTFVVPLLNDKEAFQLFTFHAFDDQICSATRNFLSLSRKFVDYARGHPQALILLGIELHGKDEAHWEHRLGIITDRHYTWIQDIWRLSTDQLNEQQQRDVFLDIVYFFKSEDEYFVRSLLDSGDPDSTDSMSEVRDLADKFLITISDGRVEMHNLLYRFSKGLGSPLQYRLWNYEDIINKLKKMELSDAHNVRGIFLDMSKLTKSFTLDSSTFMDMRNLRYLKIYDSCCPRQCIADCKLHFPEGLEFPLEEVRYLHWLKFPLKELPKDFRPDNLVDLRLPHSNVERVWEGVKDTPRLKWVDLSHSSNLLDLSALSRAENLQRLNLEGCTILDKLPMEIQYMKSLVFLNLRGCTHLSYLPEMNLVSLKTLILSDCSNLEKFQLISESLEVLHLDGTAIKALPLAIKKLQRLVLLNLKNCEMLECLPKCLGELKALEEIILSGCSRLKNLSDIKENMKHLQSLFIDWIGAKEMPHISCATISEGQASADMVIQPFGPREWPRGVNGVCSLQRLCLSGNDFVSLQTDIGKLFNLNWLDVRQCKLLTSIPMLPPKLRYFDAHGCDSLERVANPLALPVLSDKIHATFNFFNCNKLDQDAKDSIIAYTRRKSELVLDALSRYNGGSVLEDFTGSCFPGCEVPAWFSHQASGSLLKQRLPQHWCDNRFTGIALCAVILFPGYYKQRNRLFVKCKCVFNNEDESRINFSCTIGSWRKPSNTPGKIEPSHVFIGYTSTLDIKNYGEEEDEEGCSQTEASFKFQVTDGTDVLEGCKVLKCGFSLVYAIDERENIRWDPETVVIPERIENIRGIAISYEESGSRDDIHYKSYSGLCPGRDEGFFCETKSDANPILQKSLENMEVDLLNEEEDAGREFIKMRDDWTLSIGQLNERQRDVFLDIVHFFKSEDENFVKSILDSGNPEAVSEVRDLADKFLITISGGRVEMHDQLYTLAKDLGSPGQHRLCNDKDIINKMTKMKQPEANNVRGIFLDMSEIRESIALECMTFADMRNLLYLKIYDSYCPRKCNADCNLHFPDGLEFPLEEVRYLHWVKFPLQELPPDFRPENLVDLRLPYSKIERVWEDVKDTPRLKWVDLRHSVKLLDLSALSKAENLQRLNLEGCTSLDELPLEIQNMKSLVFLNLRGCIRLCYLPKMNLISLKTLILSDCSSLKEFQLISESVEFLHLDGTAIEGLPAAIQNLRRLVVLNLKNCKMLECLPNCLGKLKFLDELVLSGCSRLKSLPVVRHSLKHLQILLLDGTRANEMPSISYFTGSEGPASADISLQPSGSYSTVREYACGVNGVSSLRRLCLSGNDFVTLQPDIGKLYNLNWLDVKQCKKLIFVPTLPPRLQYFNAHGCDSLERVANPLALPVLSEQNHASFNFSNCNKLDQDAKDSIISYTRWRSQLMLDELTRYDEGFVLEAFTGTCFPGWEVPAWFSHRAFGLVLKPKLPLHFSDNMFTGIALCAVISFDGYHEQRNRLLVKCKGVFNNEDESRISFSCTIGSWSKSNNTPGKIETSHVFIGYISMLDIKKLGEEDKERCNHTEALFEFQVTDGTEVFKGCEVLKCGFSLVYATNELRVKSGVCESHLDANQYRAYSKNVAISDVRRETEAAERSPDGGDKATSPQPPIPKSHVSPVEYGSGSNNSGRERDIRMFDVDARLSGDPQHHSDNLIHMVASSSEAGNRQSHSQVFVSYHGVELHRTFIRHLVSTLTDAGVSVFTDNDKGNGIKKPMQLYQRIEESKIALAIFSKRYVESSIFLDELVLMDKLAKEGKLLVIPVFYNVRSSDVRNFTGEFGLRFKEMREIYKDKLEKVPKWETSIRSIAETIISIDSEVHGDDAHLVEATVGAVQTALTKIS